ncbi:MAG: hypothetical protein Aurels2KO_53620 [Aureliella sp.]
MRDESWDDYDEGFDDDPSDSDDVAECYHCGSTIYADADMCNHCGNFLIDSEGPVTSQPKWVLWTAILLLVMITVAAVLPALRLWTER